MASQAKISSTTRSGQEHNSGFWFYRALIATSILIVVLIVGVFTANLLATENEAVATGELFAANPELMVAQRFPVAIEAEASEQLPLEVEAARYSGLAAFYAAEVDTTPTTSSLAANPELGVARRYTAVETESNVQHELAANPELGVARRYTAVETESNVQPELAANPELGIARRYTPVEIETNVQPELAANPELSVARRYTAVEIESNVQPELAANPELGIARRFTAALYGANDEAGVKAEAARYSGLAGLHPCCHP